MTNTHVKGWAWRSAPAIPALGRQRLENYQGLLASQACRRNVQASEVNNSARLVIIDSVSLKDTGLLGMSISSCGSWNERIIARYGET